MPSCAPSVIGIDFGTTNTVMATVDAEGVAHLARFRFDGEELVAFRSALSFHATPGDPSGRVVDAGPWAIEAYAEEPFIRLLGEKGTPDTKNVTHTNFIDVAWRHDPRTGRIILLSAEDNLVKGASGQAVQAQNVMCGWPETTALL